MDTRQLRTRPLRRPWVKVTVVLSFLALVIWSLLAYSWWRPPDRVLVTLTNIDPSTRFLCLVADTPGGPEPMWWSLRKFGPFRMQPGSCTVSLFDPEREGNQVTRSVSWQDGTRYGVLTCDRGGRWQVFWFAPEEVHLRGRYWAVGGGEASIEMPAVGGGDLASEEWLDRVGIGPEARKMWGELDRDP